MLESLELFFVMGIFVWFQTRSGFVEMVTLVLIDLDLVSLFCYFSVLICLFIMSVV